MFGGFISTFYDESIPGSLEAQFLPLLRFLNQSLTAPVDALINADGIVRQISLESFFIMVDNFCDGNNYLYVSRSSRPCLRLLTLRQSVPAERVASQHCVGARRRCGVQHGRARQVRAQRV